VVLVTSDDSVQLVALAAHHDAKNNDQNALKNKSSLERVDPNGVL